MKRRLSETRGSAAGIAAFRIMLSVLGVVRTCRFAHLVAFFYALFDRGARESARPYLQHRFPGIGGLRFLRACWKLFASQGEALVMSEAASRDMLVSIERNSEDFHSLVNESKGLVLAGAHFGPWQAAMRYMDSSPKLSCFLAESDKNAEVDKFRALGASARVISIRDGADWVLDAYDALENGMALALLADRGSDPNSTSSEHVPFLGGSARFPLFPFLIASRAGAPVLPFVAFKDGPSRRLVVEIGPTLRPMGGRRSESLRQCVREYAAFLERAAQAHPFECFLFENIWE